MLAPLRRLAPRLQLVSQVNTGLLPLQQSAAYSTNPTAVIDVSTDEDFRKILKQVSDNNKLAVVDFTAKWCGPCRMMAPLYDQLSLDFPEVKFLKVDIDSSDLQTTVNNHGISAVPTFMVYKGAERVESFTGARRDLLQQILQKYKEK